MPTATAGTYEERLRSVGLRVTSPRRRRPERARAPRPRRRRHAGERRPRAPPRGLDPSDLRRPARPHRERPAAPSASVDCVVGEAPCLEPSDTHGFTVDEAELVFWDVPPAERTRIPPSRPPRRRNDDRVDPDGTEQRGRSRLDHRHRRAGGQRPQQPDHRPRRPDPAARRALPEPDGPLQPRAVPERNVHAKGSGAFGVFETTEDVSAYTKAALFQRGTTTEMLARFSTVAGEQGSPDTWRDPRGFALKFYTSEGNYDLVGNNTPVFFVRDTMKFAHFIRSQKRLGGSGLRDNQMQWDFWSLNPESAHQVTYLMGDRGIPEDVPPHERLRLAHLPLGQRGRRRTPGSNTTSTATRGSSGSRGRRPSGSPARTPTTTAATSTTPSRPATSRAGPSRSRSCRTRTRRRTGTTRST